jgi:formylglycine-generating enzyme required for sulfatase activity
MGSNPSETEYKERGVSLLGASLPVQNVSWDDIQVYIQKVSARDGVQYTLPTEAQWEYAARAGTATMYAGTDEAESVCQYGNVLNPTVRVKFKFFWPAFPCEDAYAALAPVRSFRPNAWGLYDMTGNVAEWVQDWFEVYSGSVSDYVNNDSGSLPHRVHRGGSWNDSPSNASVTYRNGGSPDTRYYNLGFRLARLQ